MLQSAAADQFRKLLPPERVLSSADDLRQYGKDWLKDFTPNAALVLLPESSEEVQAIVRIASEHRVPLVPSGGRTGLSGGATATQGEMIVSLSRMNKILELRESDRTVRVQAGVVTQRLQEEAEKHNLYFPVDFASKGSSQIGGNAATNAGGIRVIKYGNIKDWIIGLTVVTGSGELLNLNGSLFKNQTGLDLKSLFVGSEGVLGIITELTLKLTQPPGDLTRVLCALPSLENVLPLLHRVRARTHELSAFEFFTRNALEKVIQHHRKRNPFDGFYPYYVVSEFEHSTTEAQAALEEFFGALYEEGLISDVVVSQNKSQAVELMAYRELISETLSALHTLHKNDISVPVPNIPEFLTALDRLVIERYPGFESVVFGHVGDGNLHLNITKPAAMETAQFFSHCKEADHAIFALVQQFRGSISAEHGVGLLKKPFLRYSRTEAEIRLMRGVKEVFDPRGILNPGKIFDSN